VFDGGPFVSSRHVLAMIMQLCLVLLFHSWLCDIERIAT
jgi:hypothetical protein